MLSMKIVTSDFSDMFGFLLVDCINNIVNEYGTLFLIMQNPYCITIQKLSTRGISQFELEDIQVIG